MVHKGWGVVYGILNALTITLIATLVKLAEGVPSELLVFARVNIGFVLFLPVIFWKKIPIKKHVFKLHFARAIMGLIALYCYFFALQKLNLVNAILLSTTVPLFVPFVVLIWNKLKIPRRRLFMIAMGFLGVILVLKPDLGIFSWPSLVGMGTGIFGAIALVGVRQLTKIENTETILFYYFAISSVITIFPAIFFFKELLNSKVWFYMLGIGVGGVLYQYFLTQTYRYLPSTKASCLPYLSIILGGLAEWLFWDKIPDFLTVIGALLVVLGGIATILDKSPNIPIEKKG